MHVIHVLCLLLSACTISLGTSDSLADVVTWDEYSLSIYGERVFIYSGEFHYERLPVPELWRDVLEKYKANGMNAVSIYFFWSYHSARRGVFDFSSPGKDLQNLLDIAQEVGLWVIARPGPYCNAESNGGGLALWGSDGSMGELRTADETYYQAWLPWILEVGAILARNQITRGGPVILNQIENELQEIIHEANNTLVLYMEQIEQASRQAGIEIPFSSNEKGERSMSWSVNYDDVGGAVNVYGLDSYPGGLSCSNPNSGFVVVRNYYQWFQNVSFTQPEYFPEFEAGYFQSWGGYFYDQCVAEHEPAFADVYYKNNIGQRATLQSLYMAFGGTNWGNLGAPVVYTSYDYSAPLRETREVLLKFKQTKLIGLFTRVSQDLLMTEMKSNGTGNAVSTTEIFSWVLRNPDTGAEFYVLQQNETPSDAVLTFDAYLQTSAGSVVAQNVQLNGRQSKILTTNYRLSSHTLLYCSTDILVWGTFFGEDVLVLYADVGQTSEFAFEENFSGMPFTTHGSAKLDTAPITINETGNQSQDYGHGNTKYVYTQTSGSTVVQFFGGPTVYLLDLETAWNFYALPLSNNPNVSPDNQVFALGPYNIRNVTLEYGTVNLVGDNMNTTSLEVYAGPLAQQLVWNGRFLPTNRTPYGSLIATAPGADDRSIELPQLSWVVANSLPEAERDYDDSRWVVCTNSTTLSPVPPLTLPVLFSSDYGYYPGAKLYRGYFDNIYAASAEITVQGGLASGFSAWLNGDLVGYSLGNASASSVSSVLNFSNATTYRKNNVLTVVTDYTGHDETSVGPAGIENPRGILGASLYSSNGTTLNFTQWKIQGNAGGNANIDPVRGPMNEDGLHGTRLGWHLPGFVPSGPAWTPGSPLTGLNKSGINWYISHFTLNLDADLDVPLGIQLDAPSDTLASVQIYVNGYQYGKFIPYIGPQTRFPFPPGVVNNRGENTLSIALWAQTDKGAQLSNATLFAYNVYQSGFDFCQNWSDLQPGWTSERLQYA